MESIDDTAHQPLSKCVRACLKRKAITLPSPDPDLLGLAHEAACTTLGQEAAVSVVTSANGRVTIRAERADRAVAIKVYRDPSRLELEVKYTALARKCGVPVPGHLSYKSGAPAVLVVDWVDGATIHHYSAAAFELGQLLRRYYSAKPPSNAFTDEWPEGLQTRARREIRRAREMDLISAAEAVGLEPKLARLADVASGRPQMLIHGDLQAEHVLINPQTGRVSAILDFADSGFADPLWEVARLGLDEVALEEPFRRGLGVESDDALLRGYRSLWALMSATWLAENGFRERAASAIHTLHLSSEST